MAPKNVEIKLDVKEIHRIAKVLIKHKTLVEGWWEFYNELGVNDSRVSQWQSEFNRGNLSPYNLFVNILESWISQNGTVATFDSLCQTLRQIQKVSAAEALEIEFCSSNISRTSPSSTNHCQARLTLKDFINRNLPELIDGTVVNNALLIFYVANDLILDSAKQEIMSHNTDDGKADALYTLIKKFPESKLELVVKGLRKCASPAAAEIFETFCMNQ